MASHTIVASQTDGFGNTGTASLSFTLDTTAPVVAITSAGRSDQPGGADHYRHGGCGEAGTTVTLFDNGTTRAAAPRRSAERRQLEHQRHAASNGSNSLTAQVTDAAGNTGTSQRGGLYFEHHRSDRDREPDDRYRFVGERQDHLERCADRTGRANTWLR